MACGSEALELTATRSGSWTGGSTAILCFKPCLHGQSSEVTLLFRYWAVPCCAVWLWWVGCLWGALSDTEPPRVPGAGFSS